MVRQLACAAAVRRQGRAVSYWEVDEAPFEPSVDLELVRISMTSNVRMPFWAQIDLHETFREDSTSNLGWILM